MAKVSPYHTNSPEYPPKRREVDHVSGTVVDNAVSGSNGVRSVAFQTCVIETADYFYVGRRVVNRRRTNAMPLTVNTAMRFVVEKQSLSVIGDDGKAYKLSLVKKVLKTEK